MISMSTFRSWKFPPGSSYQIKYFAGDWSLAKQISFINMRISTLGAEHFAFVKSCENMGLQEFVVVLTNEIGRVPGQRGWGRGRSGLSPPSPSTDIRGEIFAGKLRKFHTCWNCPGFRTLINLFEHLKAVRASSFDFVRSTLWLTNKKYLMIIFS